MSFLTQPTRQVYAAARLVAWSRDHQLNAWPAADAETAARLWPDLPAIYAALPHRNPETVGKWCRKRWGRAVNRGDRPWSTEERRRLRSMIEEGATYRECGVALGRSYQSARKACVRFGFELTSNRYQQRPKPTGLAWYDAIRERMTDIGLGWRALRREFGIGRDIYREKARQHRLGYRASTPRAAIEAIVAALEGTVTFAPDGTPTFTWDDAE